MKKKLIATLVAGAVLSTGLIGLTACGGTKTVKMPTGGEVSEEKWVEAFERTLELENYTYECSGTSDVTVEGTRKIITSYDYSKPIEEQKGKTIDIKYSIKNSAYELSLLDTANDKVYTESTTSGESKSTYASKETDAKGSSSSKTYYELSQKEDKDKGKAQKWWKAEYSKHDSKGSEGKDSSENKWDATESSSLYNPLDELEDIQFSKKNKNDLNEKSDAKDILEATPTSIVLLYDAFTYSAGVYTAELYYDANFGVQGLKDVVKCEVKVSISDGYVVGISIKADKVEDTLYEKGVYDLKYTYSLESVYAITNIKSTDVSKKVTKDITKALDKAKQLKSETTLED